MTVSQKVHDSIRLAGLVGVLSVALVASAVAQSFSFGEVNPVASGSAVSLDIYVEGASEVAGVNFTLRMDAADASAVKLDQATGQKAAAITNFELFENTLTRTGVDNSSIPELSGVTDVVEYRAVAYSASNPPETFDATSPVQVATVVIPTGAGSEGTYTIVLASVIDNMTGLLGISDSAGTSIVGGGGDPATERPGGDVATIQLTEGGFPVVNDFTTGGEPTDWIYNAELPVGDPSSQPSGDWIDGEGLRGTQVAVGSFGYWGTAPDVSPYVVPPAGTALVASWTHTGTGSAGNPGTPNIRLRMNAADNFRAYETVLQETNSTDGIFVGNGTHLTLLEPPDYNADGVGSDGYNVFFDQLFFNVATQNGDYASLSNLTLDVLDPSTLTGEAVIYDQTFDTGENGGWTETPLDPVNGITGKPASYVTDANGIGITSSGPLEIVGDGFILAFAWWESPDLFNFDATKVYLVEADLRCDVNNSIYAPDARIRFLTTNFDFFFVGSIASGASAGDPTLPRLDMTSQIRRFWVAVPPELDGQPIRLTLDMVHSTFQPPVEDETPTLYLKSIKVTSYDAPGGG